MTRGEKAKASCTECGFEWFGETSAHALRTVGHCPRCRGGLQFADTAASPAAELEPDVPAHLVLGAPRL